MSDLPKLLNDLVASGQMGVIVIVSLVVIMCAFFVIWWQRQWMARIDSLIKGSELNMKSADTARLQSATEQRDLYNYLTVLNDELRKELERYRGDQARFENDVKTALAVGFDNLKSTLSRVTVSEIITQIPESFRRDLEREVTQATEQAFLNFVKQLENPQKRLINENIISRELESRISDVVAHTIHRRTAEFLDSGYLDRLIHEHIKRVVYQDRESLLHKDKRALEYLAEKVANHLKTVDS